ncbi:hypothetical protein CMI42_02285 [Candidatus Pacearchaeota archaeon]|nr:hypothetical protein [Candidatus Pacearchaeota archaeon]
MIVSVIAVSFMMGGVSGQDIPQPPDLSTFLNPPSTQPTTGAPTFNPENVQVVEDPTGGTLGEDPKPVEEDPVEGDPEEGDPEEGDPGEGGGGILGSINWQSIIRYGGIGAGLFGYIGALAGGDDGGIWGAIAGATGGAVAGLLSGHIGQTPAILVGLGVATAIFIATYTKTTEEIVEFHCLPWQAPIGGEDCQLCNEYEHCSEYMCKSLGQACEIINVGSEDQKCIWQNPHDVNSPIIKVIEVNEDHKFVQDPNIRPPQTGIIIGQDDGSCIQAFFPLEFTFTTKDSKTGIGEPSQCKTGYTLTKDFESMEYFVGGDQLYKTNHTERLSLPGPDAINAEAPELKNDGDYTLFIRCQDANGNFNQDAFSVSFCVDKGPDTTPPLIVDTNIPSGNPIKFNQTSLNLEVYTNEPSECRWSREDRDYENMANDMKCSNRLWEMNNEFVYTCRTTLTGIEDRKTNEFYFRCKDQPRASEGDRNENKQSYKYELIGTQPLNILEITPNETIFGATDTIPVSLEIVTDNGHDNGESLCYYYNDEDNGKPDREEDYVLFLDTKDNKHKQRQDLTQGDYVYYFKCVDLGGNAVYDSTRFRVETDRKAPKVVRAYREGDLKVITDEEAECSYSQTNCNFEIEGGVVMETNDRVHTAEWVENRNYYIRCKDEYDNQPNPNSCSIILKPSTEISKEEKSVFDFSF